jgi:hypothetical protein
MDDLEELLTAVKYSFRLCPDRRRAAAILEAALIQLTAAAVPRLIEHRAGVDGMGAPLSVRAHEPEWLELRQAVKEVISEIGLEAAARRYGSGQSTLLDIISRRQKPGLARRARLLAVVGGTDLKRH